MQTEANPSHLVVLSPFLALRRGRVIQRLPATEHLDLGHALSPVDLLPAGRHLLFTVFTIPFHALSGGDLQAHTSQMEPFSLAVLAITAYHLTKGYPVAVTVRWLVRIVHVVLICRYCVVLVRRGLYEGFLDGCRMCRGSSLFV